jgi:hypothetical protein
MRRVPIWKFPDLTHELRDWTHEILLYNERKRGKLWEEKRGCMRMGLETNYEE